MLAPQIQLQPEHFRNLDGPLIVLIEPASPENPSLVVESIVERPSHRFRERPFSMVLSGPRDPLLAQGTYAMRHRTSSRSACG